MMEDKKIYGGSLVSSSGNGSGGGSGSGAVDSVNGRTGAVVITKTDIGLPNVDNTADLDKPISTLTKNALDLKVDKVEGKGLSTNDFTTDEKTKLAGLENYDDTEVRSLITDNATTIGTKLDKTTYASETVFGVAKMWVDAEGTLHISTEE